MLVLWVWVGAVVLALVVFTFCLYELVWKSRRLQADLARLGALSGSLASLQRDVSAAQLRILQSRAPEASG